MKYTIYPFGIYNIIETLENYNWEYLLKGIIGGRKEKLYKTVIMVVGEYLAIYLDQCTTERT